MTFYTPLERLAKSAKACGWDVKADPDVVLRLIEIARAAEERPSLVRLDEQYRQGIAIAIQIGRASVSTIQRKLGIRYGEAQELVARMLRDGIVRIEDTPGLPTDVARAALGTQPVKETNHG